MKNNNSNSSIKKIKLKFNLILFKFRSLSFVKHIFVFYLFITIIGSLLLLMPISQQSNSGVSYVDALFTSASAFSDTGLVTQTTATTWTYFGQAIIAILILVGGVGWFALKIYLFNIILGRPISFRSRETLAGERGSSKVGDVRRIVKISITTLLILVIFAALLLSLYFYFVEPDPKPFQGHPATHIKDNFIVENPYHDVAISFRFGMFHAISGLNNAGFDIIGSGSLMPYYHHYGLQIIFIILFVIGGLGYPVLYDLFLWFKSKITKEKFKWSLFSKISMSAYIIVAIIGLSATFSLEITKSDGFWKMDGYGSSGDRTMALIFNTMSTRNAGFSTINFDDLSSGTLMLYIIMMFVGSAPSSTAGGIRTTTIALVVLGLWARIRGQKSVRAFNRRIPNQTVGRAYIVTTVAVFIILLGTLVLMTSWVSYGGKLVDKENPVTFLMFETASAFGTTGLSTGMTSQLSLASKFVLILIMFIGQLGVSSTLLVWDKKNNKSRKFKYIKEDVTIG